MDLLEDEKNAIHIQKLEHLVKRTSSSKDTQQKNETFMYKSLRETFEFIEEQDLKESSNGLKNDSRTGGKGARRGSSRPFLRITNLKGIGQDDPYALKSPTLIPDSIFIRHSADQGSKLWRKATDLPTDSILYQCITHSHAPSCSKSFTHFSSNLLICGSEFSVAVFDRRGVVVSPSYDTWTDLETLAFVLDVRALTQEVGLNDTMVERLGDRFIFKPFDTWIKVDATPIWRTFTLLGRCTEVWLVQEYNPSTKNVLKSEWRRPNRHAVSDINRALKYIVENKVNRAVYPFVSIAEFDKGGVGRLYPQGLNPPPKTSSLAYLRGGLVSEKEDIVVLHRTLYKTVGRPLWDYESDLELLKGLKAAIQAHKALSDQGITHRDINPRNILLAKDPENAEPGREAFLTEFFDFAKMPQYPSSDDEKEFDMENIVMCPGRRVSEGINRSRLPVPNDHHGTSVTRPVQFMSIHLLDAIVHRADSTFEHKAEHDVESFIWVLAYCVLRKVIKKAPSDLLEARARKFMNNSFGSVKPAELLINRGGSSGPFSFVASLFGLNPEWVVYVEDVVSPPLRWTLKTFSVEITRRMSAEPSVRSRRGATFQVWSHEEVIRVIDSAIIEIEGTNIK